ncbi:acyl transferase [Robiginitalea aurantiaca]|uniref:Acyl transferase n=1 Tax=Robiginitalea aurantiaca TaxID=3056915 RepID=A0ABT7WEN6_9FLAO|nr:acyl transferase [Robiginitalea aurantiaca]MDM9631384.1 acyl transferase [Robiginitalea aurantiaca]
MDTHRIFGIQSAEEFESLALETFTIQYQQVPVYREFCDHLGKTPSKVKSLGEVPFLPIEFFKSHKVLREGYTPEKVFQSSGTTGSRRSKHYVADLDLYRESFILGFNHFYGEPSKYCILALLPSYQERSDASLIHMVSELIKLSSHAQSGFYKVPQIPDILQRLTQTDTRVLLIGVSFALLDLAQNTRMPLPNGIVMETGGMKGRRKEMVREELHQILSKGFELGEIHSEYGMTELLSQAYSQGNGRFYCPPWMRVQIRDTEDPLTHLADRRTGGVDIIDLANQHSCAFISTQDLGKRHPDGSFEILGRFDHSDIRGCNLMAL